MLKESTKEFVGPLIQASLEECRSISQSAAVDPIACVGGMLRSLKKRAEYVEIVADCEQNREEAERFVAGIMGLC